MNFFTIFLIENELFTENSKKGVRGNELNGRTVQPTQLIFCALQNYRVFFYRISI